MSKTSIALLCSCGLAAIGCTPKYQTTSTIADKEIVYRGSQPNTNRSENFYFCFNEKELYSLSVSADIYNNYNIGDAFTFAISKADTQYFFDSSITKK